MSENKGEPIIYQNEDGLDKHLHSNLHAITNRDGSPLMHQYPFGIVFKANIDPYITYEAAKTVAAVQSTV